MPKYSLPLLGLIILLSIQTVAQVITPTGSNQTDINLRMTPIIHYSEASNRMYMLSESFNTPNKFYLDTMNYTSNLWGTMDSTLIADDFIVEDNGAITFVRKSGNDIELFSWDQQGQPLWNTTSFALTPIGTGKLKLKRRVNSSYWVHNDNGTVLYNFDSNSTNWSEIFADPIADLEITAANQPVVLSGLKDIKMYDSGSWNVKLDTNMAVGIQGAGISQICLDSKDSIYMIMDKGMFGLFGEYVHFYALESGVLNPMGDSILGSIEEVITVDIIADKLDNIQGTYSTLELGPWASIVLYSYKNGWVSAGVEDIAADYPNHFARPYSMEVDEYNCTHVAYQFDTDFFSGNDTTNARVRKRCDCEYIDAHNTVSEYDPELVANIPFPVTYQWLDCDSNFVAIPNETDSIFTATSNGSYALLVETNGCIDTTECYAIVSVDVTTIDALDNVHVYPNPVQSELHIESSNSEDALYSLLDVTGKVLINNIPFNAFTTIDLSLFTHGTYILKIQQRDSVGTYQIMKQ